MYPIELNCVTTTTHGTMYQLTKTEQPTSITSVISFSKFRKLIFLDHHVKYYRCLKTCDTNFAMLRIFFTIIGHTMCLHNWLCRIQLSLKRAGQHRVVQFKDYSPSHRSRYPFRHLDVYPFSHPNISSSIHP